MKKLIILPIVIIIACLSMFIYYMFSLNGFEKSGDVLFTIEPGTSTKTIAENLKKEGLIRNSTSFMVYIKLHSKTNLQAAVYELNSNMGVSAIADKLNNGEKADTSVYITFKEGINMRKIASIIADNTNNTVEDVDAVLNDTEYLDSLILKYWFIDNEILNEDIYYSLEGYLSPDTYKFEDKDIDVKTIFDKMIAQTDKILTEYKDDILSGNHTVHEILTMASIVELEGVKDEDRELIAGVFYNRLKLNMSLGSDVTTYYGAKVDMGSGRDLYASELTEVNNYNTRSSTMNGKLPISPVDSPSKSAIHASIYPKNTDYLYFVADKNGKIYYSKDYEGHQKNIKKIKDEGNWIF